MEPATFLLSRQPLLLPPELTELPHHTSDIVPWVLLFRCFPSALFRHVAPNTENKTEALRCSFDGVLRVENDLVLMLGRHRNHNRDLWWGVGGGGDGGGSLRWVLAVLWGRISLRCPADGIHNIHLSLGSRAQYKEAQITSAHTHTHSREYNKNNPQSNSNQMGTRKPRRSVKLRLCVRTHTPQ